jgi:polyisoprenoid-binding protein YceI
VVRELDLPLNISIEGDRMELSGKATLSRMDFGIGTGEWESDSSIAHAVDVHFNLLMQKAD